MSKALLSPALDLQASQPARRRYTLAFKRQVVEASLQPGVSAAKIAHHHCLNGNLLHTWRWQYRRGLFGPITAEVSVLIPVALTSSLPLLSDEPSPTLSEPRILTMRCGELHITLQGPVESATLQTLLASLRP